MASALISIAAIPVSSVRTSEASGSSVAAIMIFVRAFTAMRSFFSVMRLALMIFMRPVLGFTLSCVKGTAFAKSKI
ncbi:hypothetical protein D3C87_1341990 [compost metagenome]